MRGYMIFANPPPNTAVVFTKRPIVIEHLVRLVAKFHSASIRISKHLLVPSNINTFFHKAANPTNYPGAQVGLASRIILEYLV